MKHILTIAMLLTVMACPAFAKDMTDQSMTLGINGHEFYAFATSPAQKNGAVGGIISNITDHDLTIIRAESNVADRVELHTHLEENGVMKMRKVDSYILKAGKELLLQPGAEHIMFFDLKAPLKEGTLFSLRFYDETGASMEVPVMVRASGDIPPNLLPHKHDDTAH